MSSEIDQQFAKETIAVSLEDEMKKSYLDYAMSVIVGRALPDVRDGLKPVHRRVLYAMHELKNNWNSAYKKSARVVGDVIGKYHPHGDSAVYQTIVRMAQPFSMRYMLVDGQGNFGSVDGDAAAAMRYTEIRMAKIAHEMLADIEEETVNFGDNYDGSEREPLVLPTRFPALLVNGSEGIAVGMATSIPPHNLRDTLSGCLKLLREPDTDIHELIDIIKAPDFPTGATIYGLTGIRAGYLTGRGRVVIRSKTHIEPIGKNGEREAIIVDEIPYQVNKSKLVEKIGELVREKHIEGIAELRDESDKDGTRIVIELKRNENSEVILNQLFKLTQLQDTFGMNMVALVDGQPRLLNLKQILTEFLRHRREVVTRRTLYRLKKARAEGHIAEGKAVALSNIDAMIALIKQSPDVDSAREALLGRAWQSDLVSEMLSRSDLDLSMARPEWLAENRGLQTDGYWLSDEQARAILRMSLRNLTGLDQDEIVKEYKELMAVIVDLLDILAKPERVRQIIDDELTEMQTQFGDERRSEINALGGGDIADEDLIPPREMVVTLTHGGYIKAQPTSDYQAQRRGGRGKQAAATKDEDFIETLFVANTHDYLMCFTNLGKCHWIKVYRLPEGGRNSRGRPINNVIQLDDGEKVSAILPVRDFPEDEYVFFATAKGMVKKIQLSAFKNVRAQGIKAIELKDGDSLVGAVRTSGKDDIILFSNLGKALKFNEFYRKNTDLNDIDETENADENSQNDDEQSAMSQIIKHLNDVNAVYIDLLNSEKSLNKISDIEDKNTIEIKELSQRISELKVKYQDILNLYIHFIEKLSNEEILSLTTIAFADVDIFAGNVDEARKWLLHDTLVVQNHLTAYKSGNGVRSSGRNSGSMIGMRLPENARIVSLLVAELGSDWQVLTATQNGYGKRTPIEDYSRKGKGGQGIITIDTGERNGELVAATLVRESDDLMLITSGGVLIRTKVAQVRETGRAAQGVRLINLDEGTTLVGLERIADTVVATHDEDAAPTSAESSADNLSDIVLGDDEV